MKVDESNYETLYRVSQITLTDYDIKWTDAEDIKGFVFDDQLMAMIEDLIMEIDRLNEKIEDIEQDKEDNYRRIPISEQIGMSEKDFYEV